jgi:hypothetical protein
VSEAHAGFSNEEEYLAACLKRIDTLREPHSRALVSLEQAALQRWPKEGVLALNRDLAERLLRRHQAKLQDAVWPLDITALFESESRRIRADLESKPLEHFTLARYRLKSDLRILAHRRIPAGMFDLDIGAVPRRLLLRQPPRGLWRLAAAVFEAGGFSPFYTQHTAPHRRSLFSESERNRLLQRVAALLEQRPDVRGLVSTAWWNDPAVSRISPHLSYLRDWFERYGAGVFVIGTSADVVQDAITLSFERRRQVESGEYQPTAYLGLASRSQVLAFARGARSPGR